VRRNEEQLRAEAEKRAAKLDWYRRLWDLVCEVDQVGHGKIEDAVAAACSELNIKRANFFRYLKKYRKDPRFASLSPRLTGLATKRKARASQEARDLLKEAIDKYYLTREKRPGSKVYETYEVMCWQDKIEPVSETTMWRAIRAIPKSEIVRKRDPEDLRGKKFRLNHPISELAFAPLEVVQIDHRLLDIEAVDSEMRLPCGRPWLTAIVDQFTRAVLGFYLTLDAPGAISTARALLHAATPKAEWMASLQVPGVWEMHGVPSVVYTDNGSDFASEAIREGYRRQGINPPMFRPKGQPHYGGVVERMLLTLGLIFEGEGGDTGNTPGDKGDRKPEKSACLTLHDIERRLTNYIANDYHLNRYSKDSSPRLLWKKALQKGLFQQRDLSDEALRHFYIDFLGTVPRTINQRGVRFENLYFAAPILNKWMARGILEHDFHIDPRDARFIYFKDPDDGIYYDLPCTIPDLGAISFKDANIRLKEIWAESDELIDREELMVSRDLNLKIANDAASATRSKKAIAAAEKKRRTESPGVVRNHSPTKPVEKVVVEVDQEEDDDAEIVAFEMTTLVMENR